MHLLLVGLNHKTAPLELRERFAFAGQALADTLQSILLANNVASAVLVSTCNRTELYLEASSLAAVRGWFLDRGLEIFDLGKYIYFYKNEQVVRHLMHVACGLDSMVLGEVEILGQLKAAYHLSAELDGLTKMMDKLFQTAFAAAKKVRTQTEINLNPVSIASLAVRVAQNIIPQLPQQKILIVGAGATAGLLLKHLCSAGVQEFIIANRTLAKSQGLAGEIAAGRTITYIELAQVPEYLPQVAMVVTTTAAPLPIIGKGMVEKAMQQRTVPLFMLDLSMPRNIEPQVQEVPQVRLQGIDDLQSIAAEHRKTRYTAARQATLILEEEVANFMRWRQAQSVVGTIQIFRQAYAKHSVEAMQLAIRQLQAGKDPAEVLQRFAHGLLNKLLHHPTVQLRSASMAGDLELLASARRLFNIETET